MISVIRSPRESITVPTCAVCAAFSRASGECALFHLDEIAADLVPNFRSNRAERKGIQLSSNRKLKRVDKIKHSKDDKWPKYSAVKPTRNKVKCLNLKQIFGEYHQSFSSRITFLFALHLFVSCCQFPSHCRMRFAL